MDWWLDRRGDGSWVEATLVFYERERRVIVVAEDEGGGNRGYGDHDVHKSW